MKCPSCGSDNQKGKFCSQCGAALQGGCAACGAELPAGSRFCTRCGEAVAGGTTAGAPGRGAWGRRAWGRRARGLGWPWIVGSAAVVLLVLVFMLPRQTDRAGPPAMTDPGAGAPPLGGDALLSSDMRTNADRLFNRIMAAAEQGNSAEVAQFMPMAVQAYGMVEDLDHDGLYHLAILHLTAGETDQARATAQRILDDAPDHILALGVAAAAAREAGDDARARVLYRRLIDAYPDEAARPIPEYLDHQRMLPEYRRAAREALGEDG